MKKRIRLNESQLRAMVAESVRRVLEEGLYGFNGNNPEDWEALGQLRRKQQWKTDSSYNGSHDFDDPEYTNYMEKSNKQSDAANRNLHNSYTTYKQQHGTDDGWAQMTDRVGQKVNAYLKRNPQMAQQFQQRPELQ